VTRALPSVRMACQGWWRLAPHSRHHPVCMNSAGHSGCVHRRNFVQNPLSDPDIEAMLHLLAIVQDRVSQAGDSLLAQQLRDGLAACGLLPGDAHTDALAGAIANLQARYRYSLGEYTERPAANPA
jgi:hypothetical protein